MAANDKINKLKAKASAGRRSGVDAFISAEPPPQDIPQSEAPSKEAPAQTEPPLAVQPAEAPIKAAEPAAQPILPAIEAKPATSAAKPESPAASHEEPPTSGAAAADGANASITDASIADASIANTSVDAAVRALADGISDEGAEPVERAPRKGRRTKKAASEEVKDAGDKSDRMTVLMTPHIKVYLMLMAKREGIKLTEYVERLIVNDYKKKIDPQLNEVITYIVNNK